MAYKNNYGKNLIIYMDQVFKLKDHLKLKNKNPFKLMINLKNVISFLLIIMTMSLFKKILIINVKIIIIIIFLMIGNYNSVLFGN